MRPVRTHGPYAEYGPFFGMWAAADEGCEGRTIRAGDQFAVTARGDESAYMFWRRGGSGAPMSGRAATMEERTAKEANERLNQANREATASTPQGKAAQRGSAAVWPRSTLLER